MSSMGQMPGRGNAVFDYYCKCGKCFPNKNAFFAHSFATKHWLDTVKRKSDPSGTVTGGKRDEIRRKIAYTNR